MNFTFQLAYGIVQSKMAAVNAKVAKHFNSFQSSVPEHIIPWFDERTNEAVGIYEHYLSTLFQWLLNDREHTNFTFQSSPVSDEYLINTISMISGHPYDEIKGYFLEFAGQTLIQQYIDAFLEVNPNVCIVNPRVTFGRRVGWYALIRATKPRYVVETGIDKGLSSCLLSLALLLNTQEGKPGKYIGIDINKEAGFLYQRPFTEAGDLIFADSIETLKKLDNPVDIIILDSDHTEGYERKEYEACERTISQNGVIISDTARYDDALFKYARETNRVFHYAPEYLSNSWYPGDGNGYATRKISEPLFFQK